MNNIFEVLKEPYKITKPIRLIELFGGIGSQAKALENLKANFEHYRLCEFDEKATISYNAIHNTNFTPSDVTKISGSDLGIINTKDYEYILTYSFPCQDLSVSGKMQGCAKGSGTRSGLLWEVERLLNETKEKPQILLMENVIQLHSSRNIEAFQSWIKCLEDLGYSNYWQDLDASDYGMPQGRKRCFMISILGDYSYNFPKPIKLEKTLVDFLDNEVDNKYYFDNKKVERTLAWRAQQKPFKRVLGNKSICPTITARGAGGDHSGMIIYDSSLDNTENLHEYLLSQFADKVEVLKFKNKELHLRNLTPKESWKLMGFTEEDFEKAKACGINDASLYKQSGNSIVVDVLMAIFKQLLR